MTRPGVSDATLRRTAAGLCAVFLLLNVVVTPGLAVWVNRVVRSDLTGAIAGGGLVAVGGLIGVRRPRNWAAWLLLAAGIGQTMVSLLPEYGRAAAQHPALPWGRAVWAIGGGGWWLLMFITVPALMLIFPEGQLPSSRWRPVMWGFGVAAVLGVVTPVLGSRTIGGDTDSPANPLYNALPSWVAVVGALSLFAFMVPASFAALYSLLRRARRAVGITRSQFQWFGFGGAMFVLSGVLAFVPHVPQAVVGLGLGAFLGCLTVAMLRFRLYDIGRVVSRTATYLLLTAMLLLLYVAVVALLSQLLPLTNGLAVATATLAAAAAFNPLRKRVQGAVDRRFNRSRYDAARVVDAFAGRLRDEVDLKTVREFLLAATCGSVHPVTVSLWTPAASRQEA